MLRNSSLLRVISHSISCEREVNVGARAEPRRPPPSRRSARLPRVLRPFERCSSPATTGA